MSRKQVSKYELSKNRIFNETDKACVVCDVIKELINYARFLIAPND